jgi:trehalose/maltose hydrolase-like predicted phosphorylase
VHAALLARAGDPDRALELFRLACRLDLDDLTGTTAGGLHLATFGGVWQALVHGFLGLRPAGGTLHLNPELPAAWEEVAVRLRFHGCRVRVRASHDRLGLEADGPLRVAVAGQPTGTVAPPGASWRRSAKAWEQAPPWV